MGKTRIRRFYMRWWPYLWVTLAVVLTAWTWFPGSAFMAGGDIFPSLFLRPSGWLSAFHTWGTELVGVGSPQYASPNLLMGFAAAILRMIGLPPGVAQWVFMVALLLLQGWGMVFLLQVLFPFRRLAQALGGLGFVFNLFGAINDGNPVLAFAMGFFPFTAALYLTVLKRSGRRPLRYGILLGVLSLGSSFLFATPPLFAFWFLWLLAFAALAWWQMGRGFWSGSNFLLHAAFGLVFVGINGWWLYAADVVLYGAHSGVQQTFQNPFNWSWVSQRASIINLLTQQGGWSWPQLGYYPWAEPYIHGFLGVFLFLPPLLAVVGFVAGRSSWRQRLFLLGMVLLSLFIAKGFHAPFGSVNAWLYVHVPYFWLFRDPQVEWSIPLLTGMYALAALGTERLLRLATRLRIPRRNFRVKPAGALLIAILMLNGGGYALAAGTYLPRPAPGENSAFVHIPPYWKAAAAFLNRYSGRTLILPNDDFYQMPYSWGYYGADAVPTTLLHQALLLAPNTGGYLGGSTGFGDVETALVQALAAGKSIDLAPVLRKLGVRYLLVRKDILSSLPGRGIISPAFLDAYLQRQPWLHLVQRFGPLAVFALNHPGHLATESNRLTAFQGEATGMVWAGSLLPAGGVANAGSSRLFVSRSFRSLPTPSAGAVPLGRSSPGVIAVDPSSAEVFIKGTATRITLVFRTAAVIANGQTVGAWQVSRSIPLPPGASPDAVSLGLQRFPLHNLPADLGGISLPAGGLPYTVWQQQRSLASGYIRLPQGWVPIGKLKHSANLALSAPWFHPIELLQDPGFRHGLWIPPFNANNVDRAPSPQAAGLSASVDHHALRLSARTDAAGEGQTLHVIPGYRYRITFQYRHITGSAPTYAVWQVEAQQSSPADVLSATPGWHSYTTTFRPLPGVHTVQFDFYSYANGGPTVNEYRDASLLQLPLGGPRVAVYSPREVPSRNVPIHPAGSGMFTVSLSHPGYLVVKTQYHPDWAVFPGTPHPFWGYLFASPLPWPHFVADGYANGWKAQPGTYTLVYRPQLTEDLLVLLALLTGGLSILTLRRGLSA